MRSFDYPILAPEGRVHMIIAISAGLFASVTLGWWSILVWLLVLFVFQFFRDPKRKISGEAGAVVAPASGKVVFIGEAPNPYLENTPSLKVSIFMNVFSVHSNLIPVGGTVRECWYHPGKFLNAALDKSSSENERNAVWIATEHGEDVVSVQIAGLIARRILCYAKRGDQVETGQRYGFIRFGSRVDLYLPQGTGLKVKLGQWVSSGNDVVANLSR
jgi:phosphatidylserine decarboxylase